MPARPRVQGAELGAKALDPSTWFSRAHSNTGWFGEEESIPVCLLI